MKSFDVIVKLTTSCNLQCTYCNVEERVPVKFPLEEIDKLMDWLDYAVSSKVCSILWHGGEPLILGKSFFTRIFESEKRYPGRFSNTVSTNALLLDNAFIELLGDNHVTIKTSLDTIHTESDRNRCNSCALVVSKLNLLRELGYKDVYVRTTVSNENEGQLVEMYDFMKANYKFNWEFAPIIPAGLNKSAGYAVLPDPEKFSRGAIDVFHDWLKTNSIEIPFFIDLIKAKLGILELPAIANPRLNIGPTGTIYRCPLLIGNEKYAIGNYLETETFNQFCGLDCAWETISKNECLDCDFNRFCRITSCSYLSVSFKGLEGLADFFCRLWKPVYHEICAAVDFEIGAIKKI
ncbi:MAG: radical SAM protein [Clostridiales bacterium]|jgi:radical SAM protein with 4Fe4S-binding SPASM domain|nr:radical SAM protein [Clostridiales bacterium]